MQFRDLQRQYQILREKIDAAMQSVLDEADYISGKQVAELEAELAEYVGVKHCVTCANGTDALLLALMVWNIGSGDAVFLPDFTFFSTGEVVAARGATPIFVDVDKKTFNMNPDSLEKAIEDTIRQNELVPKVVIPVDLFGRSANYDRIIPIAQKHGMLVLEDGAQGFGGSLHGEKNCSFGDISTTSFFPAKPVGCYGDGGAVFTDSDEWAELLKSYRVHGKGTNKYDNIRIGLNSRLDTIQAAVLRVKLEAFINYELRAVNEIANKYTAKLKEFVEVPEMEDGYISSWAQYTIILKNRQQRDDMKAFLQKYQIPSMVYYQKPMHLQEAFANIKKNNVGCEVTEQLCECVLSLPMHPYMSGQEIESVCDKVIEYLRTND